MMNSNLLIVFLRNPELGKVKTRLAKKWGNQKALDLYKEMVAYTKEVTDKVSSDKAIYYSEFVDYSDSWPGDSYQKYLQKGQDLGERLFNAFKDSLSRYKNVIIIGSDCLEITPKIITEGFSLLEKSEVVIGPAHDGGYYLIGMNKLFNIVFKDKPWSTKTLLVNTIKDLIHSAINFELLESLSDVDE